jgi:hypothetical protein
VIDAARAVDIVALAERVGARLKRIRAAEWKWAGPCPCPGCGGTDRFALNTERRIFNCRGAGGGDAIAMVRHVLGLDFVEAVEFITGEKRVKSPIGDFSNRPANLPVSEKRAAVAPWLWRQRQPIAYGSPPWTYLRTARGFTGAVPATLGYLAPHDGYPPSMIAAYGLAREPEPGFLAVADADVQAVHVTRLAPDGAAKAGGAEGDKISIGWPRGSPIVLAPANDGAGLAITEGIEDGLSIHAATGLGVWAAGAAPYMPALAQEVPAWIDCVTVVGHQDKDGVRYSGQLISNLKARGFDTRLTFLATAGALS